eukprot:evm.model.scf_303EXC.1 EVM.evm.TU.scf_303EXC.1   scf_303EXC:1395-14605(+)
MSLGGAGVRMDRIKASESRAESAADTHESHISSFESQDREIVALLNEGWFGPKVGIVSPRHRTLRPKDSHDDKPLRERLDGATPAHIGQGKLQWSRLKSVHPSELLKSEFDDEEVIEVNSGGRVLFCFFESDSVEGSRDVAIAKFGSTRLAMQAEHFANELTRHLDISAPMCRIVRKEGPTSAEWEDIFSVAKGVGKRGEDLVVEMEEMPCMLLMEFVKGKPLLEVDEAFKDPYLESTMHDLGRVFLLDMLLGNPDRLPSRDLAWRGNAGNLLFGSCDQQVTRRVVAIDSCVPRKPPVGKATTEDEAVQKMAELIIHDTGVAQGVLQQVVQGGKAADSMAGRTPDENLAQMFQEGLKTCLGGVLKIQGLLEMMCDVISEWITEFLKDIEESTMDAEGATTDTNTIRTATPRGRSPTPPRGPATPPPIPIPHVPTSPQVSRPSSPSGSRTRSPSPMAGRPPSAGARATTPRGGRGAVSGLMASVTVRLKKIKKDSRQDEMLAEKVQRWKEVFRSREADLRTAVGEWQHRHGLHSARFLTTGFLDGTHPIVDAYELKIRLEHMLRRLRMLQDAASTARPIFVAQRVYLGNAMASQALHTLKHLGVGHIVNATDDLLLPDDEWGFVCMRVAMADNENEDIERHFESVRRFINSAKESGSGVLVHCHEGKSRSAALVLAYLLMENKWTLKDAMAFLLDRQPKACPNPGFMQRLLDLDERLNGKRSLKVKKKKPEAKVCPLCSEAVGISEESLMVHMRSKHGA